MNRDQLSELNAKELREHAEVAGITLGAADNKGTMIDKILGEYAQPGVKAKAAEKPLPILGKLRTLDGKPVEGRNMKVTIFATETDKSPVDLIVNGHNIRVKRGEQVIMHEAYVEVLRNAVVDTVVQDPDSGVRTPQQMLCHPFSAEYV